MFTATEPLSAQDDYVDRASARLTARRQKTRKGREQMKESLDSAVTLPLYQRFRYGPDNKIVRINRNNIGHPLSKKERKDRRDAIIIALHPLLVRAFTSPS